MSVLQSIQQVLERVQQVYEQMGLEAELFPPDAESNFFVLIVRFPLEGSDRLVDVEFTAIPEADPQFKPGEFFTLQTYTQLSDAISAQNLNELLWLVVKLNTQLPIGQFGVFDNLQILYFKQNCLINHTIAPDSNLSLIQRQTQLFLTVLSRFIHLVLPVANGHMKGQEALDTSSLRRLFL